MAGLLEGLLYTAGYYILDIPYALREHTQRPHNVFVEFGREPVAGKLRGHPKIDGPFLYADYMSIFKPRIEIGFGYGELELDQCIFPKFFCGCHTKSVCQGYSSLSATSKLRVKCTSCGLCVDRLSLTHVADISAKNTQKSASPRLSKTQSYPGWQSDTKTPRPQGSCAPLRLSHAAQSGPAWG